MGVSRRGLGLGEGDAEPAGWALAPGREGVVKRTGVAEQSLGRPPAEGPRVQARPRDAAAAGSLARMGGGAHVLGAPFDRTAARNCPPPLENVPEPSSLRGSGGIFDGLLRDKLRPSGAPA